MLERERLPAAFAALAATNPGMAEHRAELLLETATKTLLDLVQSRSPSVSDTSELWLNGHMRRLADQFAEWARAGRGVPLATAWYIACRFAEVIHDLALDESCSEDAKWNLFTLGSQSLFLPSLRSRNKNFTFDFEKVAEAIQLSDFCAVDMTEKSQARPDSPITMFTIQTLEMIGRLRREVQDVRLRLAMRAFRRDAKDGDRCDPNRVSEAEVKRELTGESLTEWEKTALGPRYPVEWIPIMLKCLQLEDLNKSTVDQWTEIVCSIIEMPETLKRLEGTKFYRILEQSTDGKDYQMRDELKTRVKQALKSSLVPPQPMSPWMTASQARIQQRVQSKRARGRPIKPGGK